MKNTVRLLPKNASEWSIDELAFLSAFRNSTSRDNICLFLSLMHEYKGDLSKISDKVYIKVESAYLGNEMDYLAMLMYLGLDDEEKIEYLKIACHHEANYTERKP